MAVKEVDWQYKIIQSARAQGGFGGKWSSQYQVGKPDLVLRLPYFGQTFLMEVKLFKDLPASGKFDRVIDITAKQRYELELHAEAGGVSVIGVVLYYRPGVVRLAALPWRSERLAAGQLDGAVACGSAATGGIFDLEALMGAYQLLEEGADLG